MSDVVAWLVAKLDRVEQLARTACPVRQPVANGEVWSVEEYAPSAPNAVQNGAWVVTGPDGENGVAFVQGDRRARHIALHDPAAVLRRVSADRQILAEHGSQDDGGLGAYQCRVCAHRPEGDWYHYLVPYPCRTVLLLAEAWGWTEDAT